MRNAYGNAWAEFYDIEFTLGMEKYYADAKMIFEYEAFFDEFGKWEIEDYKLDSIYEVTIYSEDGDEIKPDKELVDAMYKEVSALNTGRPSISSQVSGGIITPSRNVMTTKPG